MLYTDESRTKVLTTFHTLRQQMDKPEDQPNYALADFIAPAETGRADYLGAFAVTAGLGVDEVAREFEKDHDDYNAIMAKALADRLAEASAEWLHRQARLEWGFGADGESLQRRIDHGKVSRHPPGAGLSRAAGPHREAAAVRFARRGEKRAA